MIRQSVVKSRIIDTIRQILKKIWLTLYIFFVQYDVTGQAFSYYNYSISNGLPSSEVYDIHQDEKGFLWFATDNGVAKYDGDKFEIFHINQGLTDPVVFGFHEDQKGRLWFRTYSGKLSYFNNGKILPYESNKVVQSESKPYSFIYSIHMGDSALWIGGKHFIGKITIDGLLKEYPTQDGALVIKSVDQNHILGHYNSGSIKYLIIDNTTFSISLINNNFYDYSFRILKYKTDLLIGINNDIFRYSGKSLDKVFSSPHLIISLSKDKEENIWVGYLNKGVQRFNENFEDLGYLPFLNEKSVTKVLHDSENGLWISTLESGIYHIPNTSIENYNIETKAKIRSASMFNDKALLGDQSGNLYSFDLIEKKSELVQNIGIGILTIFQDSRNKYWMGTRTNTILFDQHLKRVKAFPDKVTLSFSEDKFGIIWSQGGNRLRQYNLNGEPIKDLPANVIYRSLFADDSLLFLTGRTGLSIRDKNANILKTPNEFPDYKITTIAPLNDSILFLATQGSGFILLNKNTWKHSQFDTKNSFIANTIYSYLKYDSTLLMGTEKGIIEADINSLLNGQPNFRILHFENGLLGERVNFLMRYKNSVLAVSDEGVSIIPKIEFVTKKEKPIFYIKDLTINQHHLDSNQYKRLSFDQNNIQLTYGFIAFSGNQNILSRFRLAPTEPWIYPANRTIELYSLAPGLYSLDLEFSTDNTVWHSGIRQLIFKINSPWWKVWYYQVAGAVLFLFFGFIYFKNRIALVKQNQHFLEIINENQKKLLQTEIETTERERSRIAKDLHDSIGTNMVAAKIIIGQLLRKHHEPLTEQVENQLQTIILETKEIIYDLSPPGIERYGLFTLIKNQVEKIQYSTQVNITLETFGEEPRKNPLNIMILRILQELMTNSLKHAQAKNILMEINAFDDRINIIYEDDGKGFSYRSNSKGLGLHNIDSRIESLQGQLKFESGDFGISYNIDIPIQHDSNFKLT
ncbi:MAG: hypothetical protein JNM57_00780 [Cyclobacteriaceae bacterium]|nr:hypothetical protein [Cyclobacteriaceae bacterium]